MDRKRPLWIARSSSALIHLLCFGIFAVAYLFAAAIWDEMENEYYIYNYNWNFVFIDSCIWKVIPALAFCFLLWRLVNIFINNAPGQNISKRIREI